MDSLLLRAVGLQKSYNVPVLKDFDFTLIRGEVHALVGSNGAGKSTFANILCGLTRESGGDLYLKDKRYTPQNRREAQEAGVVMVMQELNIIPTLSVAENLFFDKLPQRMGFIDRALLHSKAVKALSIVGLEGIDPDIPASALGLGHQQLVEIAAALAKECDILILDEPTAALTGPEIKDLFTQIRGLQQQGVGILYISHRMEEIREISDRVTVLRDGRGVATHASNALDMARIIREMAGKSLATVSKTDGDREFGKMALEVENLVRKPILNDVSLSIRYGEILGIAGLVGSGRTACLKSIFGAEPRQSGTIRIDGHRVVIRNPEAAVRLGLAMVTEDRKEEGLLLTQPVRANATLSAHEQFSACGWMRPDVERQVTLKECDSLEVKLDDIDQDIAELSGGNQQKVLMIRWLIRDCRILLLDEPTRGIDVAAKATLYRLFRYLTKQGKAIMLVSSELTELIQLCDRISVMSDGRITGTFEAGNFDESIITEAAFAGYMNDK